MTHDLYIPSVRPQVTMPCFPAATVPFGDPKLRRPAAAIRRELRGFPNGSPRRKPGRPCSELSGVAEKPRICWHNSGICCREDDKIMRKQ